MAGFERLRQPKVFNPPQESQHRRPSLFLKFIIKIIFVFLFLGTLSYFFFYSSVFEIKNIIISDSSLSVADLEYLKGRNIFLCNLRQIRQEILDEFPELANVKIIRGLPDTLKVVSQLHESKIIWRTQNRLYVVGHSGIILREVRGETDLPIVQDNKDLAVDIRQQVVLENFVDFVVNLHNKFPLQINANPLYYEINETIFQLDALTDLGWLVKFDITRSLDSQLEALQKLIQEHKDEVHEYADVRVEGKVYFK